MVILSVDYGDVRTGIALCDINEMLAYPVCVITQRNAEKLAVKISELATENHAQIIVVGYPKNMDGSEGFKTDSVKELKSLIMNSSDLPVELWDERLTTVSAHRILSENNVRGKKRKDTVDAVAAVIILQDYIDFRRNKG